MEMPSGPYTYSIPRQMYPLTAALKGKDLKQCICFFIRWPGVVCRDVVVLCRALVVVGFALLGVESINIIAGRN
jgi:hypothetical protein